MSRRKELLEFRKQACEIIEKSSKNDVGIGVALRNLYLMEISETLALMYDKMCEEQEDDK